MKNTLRAAVTAVAATGAMLAILATGVSPANADPTGTPPLPSCSVAPPGVACKPDPGQWGSV